MAPTVVKATATQFAGRRLWLEITSAAVRRPSARPPATATASQPTVPAPPAARCSQPVIDSECAAGASESLVRFLLLDRSRDYDATPTPEPRSTRVPAECDQQLA